MLILSLSFSLSHNSDQTQMTTQVSLDTWRSAKLLSRCLHGYILLTFAFEIGHASTFSDNHELFSPFTKKVAMAVASVFFISQGLWRLLSSESEVYVLLPIKLWRAFLNDLFIASFMATCYGVARAQNCERDQQGLSVWMFVVFGQVYLVITLMWEYDTRDSILHFMRKGEVEKDEKSDSLLLLPV